VNLSAIWYVWFTASKSDFAETLCAKLIRRGWTVGPLARTLILEPEGSPACVVALSIHRVPRTKEEEKEYTATGVHSELCDVMKYIKGKFWSLVVSEAAGCTWNVGLGKLNEDGTDKEQAEAAKKVN
jgi:hypothetical protein